MKKNLTSIEGYYLGTIPGRNKDTLYKVTKSSGSLATMSGIASFYNITIIRDKNKPGRIDKSTQIVADEIHKALNDGILTPYEPTDAEKVLYGL